MIEFQRPALSVREQYNAVLFSAPERGCEYSFANLVLWGRQNIAFLHGYAARFSHFNGKTVYPYPVGTGDKQAVLALLHADADARGGGELDARVVAFNPKPVGRDKVFTVERAVDIEKLR